MFGMSFGKQPAPSPVHKEALDNSELTDSLIESGVMDSSLSVSPEDLTAIKARADILEKRSHMNHDTAAVFAYIDRMITIEKGIGNTDAEAKIISKVTTDMVSAVVRPDLASHEEFLKTVIASAVRKYQEGTYAAFSDALMEAVDERQKEIARTPEVSGKIDVRDNVLMGEDLK
jgi:hypothetical protein